MSEYDSIQGLIMNTVHFKLGKRKVRWKILNIYYFPDRTEIGLKYRLSLFRRYSKPFSVSIDAEVNITLSLLEDYVKSEIENRRNN